MVRFMERNGIKLAYLDSGPRSSPETIVIIHGWADRHELFLPMINHFRERYRVIAVDLRGHGQSDKPKIGYEVANLADDVASICERLGQKRIHLIGHSLGGAVSLDLASRYPNRVASLTSIEGAIVFPAAVREGMKPMRDALRSPKWKATMHKFIDSCYLPTDDPALRQYSYRELDRLPQHVHIGVYDGVMAWNSERAASAWKKPLLYIEGGSGLTDLARLKTLCPQLVIGQAVGVSHMQIVATPDQPLAMIDRFLKVYVKRV